MQNKRIIIIIASIGVSLLIIGGALIASHKQNQTTPVKAVSIVREHNVSRADLEKANGKNGYDCLVAVDGTVYKIEGFSLWQNGEHTTSKGMAHCGADLTSVIDKSPHGRKVLKLLIKVGPLVN